MRRLTLNRGERLLNLAANLLTDWSEFSSYLWSTLCNWLLFIIRFYTSNYNPLVGIAQLKLGKILPHVNEFQSAINHIREAGDILKVKKILYFSNREYFYLIIRFCRSQLEINQELWETVCDHCLPTHNKCLKSVKESLDCLQMTKTKMTHKMLGWKLISDFFWKFEIEMSMNLENLC